MTSWEDFGGDPAPGSTSDLASLGDALGSTAEVTQSAHDRLKRLKAGVDDSIWRGKSADAFKESIEKAPEHLAKLHESYAAAAEALHGYAGTLGCLQSKAGALLPELEAARGSAATAQTSHDTAPPEQQAGAQSAVDQAKSYLGQLTAQVQEIRDERRKAEDTAIGRLHTAHELGIKNQAWWHHALHTLATVVEFFALVLAIVAIIIIVLAVPGGWVALFAAFEVAGDLFVASSIVGLIAVGIKSANKASGGEEASWTRLAWEGGIAAVGIWGGSFVEGATKFGRFAEVARVGSGYLVEATEATAHVPAIVEAEGLVFATVATVPILRVSYTPVELFTVSAAHAGDLANVLDVTLGLYTVGSFERNHPEVADPVLLGAALAVPEAAPALALGVGLGNKVDEVLSSLGID